MTTAMATKASITMTIKAIAANNRSGKNCSIEVICNFCPNLIECQNEHT